MLGEKCVITEAPNLDTRITQNWSSTWKSDENWSKIINHQKWENQENAKSGKSDKIRKSKNTKNRKIKSEKVKKVVFSKNPKNGQNVR